MNKNDLLYAQNTKAKRGFASEKKELIQEWRILNNDITHYIIGGECLDPTGEKRTYCDDRIKEIITRLNEILH
jgi:hypothetical protein